MSGPQRFGVCKTIKGEPNSEDIIRIKREIALDLATCIERVPYIIKYYPNLDEWTIAQKIVINCSETERIERVDIPGIGNMAIHPDPPDDMDQQTFASGNQDERLRQDG